MGLVPIRLPLLDSVLMSATERASATKMSTRVFADLLKTSPREGVLVHTLRLSSGACSVYYASLSL